MESLYLLIPLSLVIVAIAVWIFIRASETGQFDDLVGPAHSILMDDDRPRSALDAGESHRKPQKPSASTD
jgi:cbb3-type cytochrome oxidase maturation protein